MIAAAAQAKRYHVTGQQTVVTPSTQFTQFLSTHGITVTAIGRASIANGALTLPIVRGSVALTSKRGILIHRGGIQFATATRTITLRHFVVTRTFGRAVVSARVGLRRLPLARVSSPTLTISGKTATASGELRLTAVAAREINHLFGTHVVSAGADLGSATSTITVA